jgi:cytochrome c oxidase assembly protein subunit 11
MTRQSVNRQKPIHPSASRRDLVVAFACGACVAVMVGASFAAVPFYNWFCRTTGYNGTTQVAKSAPAQVMAGRTVTVRFDSNVAAGLPWRFEPERRTIDVKLGEVVTVYYKVTNEAARITAGQAAYNVSPLTIGRYFEKINCFCFTQQTMKPGETRDMAVVFYVDPTLADDAEQSGTTLITLSYTFYPVRVPEPPVADSTPTLPSPASGGG